MVVLVRGSCGIHEGHERMVERKEVLEQFLHPVMGENDISNPSRKQHLCIWTPQERSTLEARPQVHQRCHSLLGAHILIHMRRQVGYGRASRNAQ